MQNTDVIGTLVCLILTSIGISVFLKTSDKNQQKNNFHSFKIPKTKSLDKFVVLTSAVPYKEPHFTWKL